VINKVWVANRGEIAVRVLRTCKELGLATVAVFSEADRGAPHVRYADEAFCIGEPPAQQSYLCSESIIEAALQASAQAVHPGYGFLSESAAFARDCAQAGLTFVGPRPDTVALLGDKVAARSVASDLGIPVTRGSRGTLDDHQLLAAAGRLGYPLLLKAAAGGGGMGIQAIHSHHAMQHAIPALRRKARRSFGDDSLYLEQMVEGARHIEVQILGDCHGRVIHLGERECSIQRRHQKLVEESPSPSLDETLRQLICEAAVRIGQAVGYIGAGTVEFLLDAQDRFYFLEVNPRLQVEHTVTEMVTGMDVVKEQLRIAAGRKLPCHQDAVRPWGWGLQCRILAEDPFHDCRPTHGQVSHLVEPAGPGIRVDSGICAGYTVSSYYDTLLAKLISWGKTRPEAIVRMRRALDEYRIVGLTTNLELHRRLLDSYRFFAGRINTRFLEEHLSLPPANGDHHLVAALAAALLEHRRRSHSEQEESSSHSPWKMLGQWELLQEWSSEPPQGWPHPR